MSDAPTTDGDDDDPTGGAELDWDHDEYAAFLNHADPDYQAPVDVIVEADD